MNSSATAQASVSTLAGASVATARENDFMNIGRDMVKVEQNVKLTVNRYGDDPSEVREGARSGPIANANVFATLATLLGGIFGPKAREINPSFSGSSLQQLAPEYDARDHSESRETITEIMNTIASAPLSVLDTSDSTVSLLTQSSSSERYIRSMLECNEGYPLYEPEPECQYCQEGVRVGDVGLVTEDGGFDFLFNVCPQPDNSTNPAELPDDFEILKSPEILVKAHFQSDTRLFNDGVKRTEDLDVRYTCSGTEGGILELPLGATRFGAKNKFSFKELAARHAENWYRYTVLTRGRDAPNGSLYIVTSCIKCTDWGIAVFNRPSNPQDYLQFITRQENQNGQSKYRWKGSGAYIAKVASNRGGTGSNDADGPNQCVFLRGYKVMLPKDIWDNIVNNGASYVTVSSRKPHSGDKSEFERKDDSSTQDDASQRRTDHSSGSNFGTTRASQDTGEDGGMASSARVILYEYSKASPAHPSDLINAMLLYQEPKAKVAVTHDDDWCDLLRYNTQILNSDTVVGLSYTSSVDKYGCASLKRSDLNPGPKVTAVESSTTSLVTSALEDHSSTFKMELPSPQEMPLYQYSVAPDDLFLDATYPTTLTLSPFIPSQFPSSDQFNPRNVTEHQFKFKAENPNDFDFDPSRFDPYFPYPRGQVSDDSAAVFSPMTLTVDSDFALYDGEKHPLTPPQSPNRKKQRDWTEQAGTADVVFYSNRHESSQASLPDTSSRLKHSSHPLPSTLLPLPSYTFPSHADQSGGDFSLKPDITNPSGLGLGTYTDLLNSGISDRTAPPIFTYSNPPVLYSGISVDQLKYVDPFSDSPQPQMSTDLAHISGQQDCKTLAGIKSEQKIPNVEHMLPTPQYTPDMNSSPSMPDSPPRPLPPVVTSNTVTQPQRPRKVTAETINILKAWFLRHSDHPYPTEEEKRQLCSTTGLTMSQVSNWLIIARRKNLAPKLPVASDSRT